MNPFRRSVMKLVGLAALAVTTLALSWPASAENISVNLAPGAGAPNAVGRAKVEFDQTTLEGTIRVKHLPRQPFGSGHFYGAWFVRTDTQDKAFLGALINDRSIIFSAGGEGRMEFEATHFTDGPNAGSPITRGPAGSNLIIVLIENVINGLTPSPVGVAVEGTF